MHPALEIRLVRDNLSLAMALSKSTDNGLITPLHVLPEDNPAGGNDGTPAPAPNALSRRIGNQVRASFGFSVLQAQQSLERVYPSSPLTELRSSLKGARCTVYLLSISLRRGMLSPVWVCPPEYRQRFEVPSISLALDASILDGTPVVWEQFGGLGKYLELLDYCAAWVQAWDPESPASPESLASVVPDVPAPAPAPVTPAPSQVPPTAQVAAPAQVSAPSQVPAPAAETTQVAAPVINFVQSRCYRDPEALCPASALFKAYQDWCLETASRMMTQRSFGLELTKMGFQRRRRGQGYHWWQGIGLAGSE